MKKVTCLLLVLVLVCSMGASALATDGINVRSEEFDTSVFQGVPNIGVDYDDMENKGYIYLVDPTPSLFMLTPDASYYSRIYPNIFYDKYRISFSIYMDFIAKKPAGINSMIVKIGDKRYRFKDIKRYTIDWDNMTTSNTEVLEGGDMREKLWIKFGPSNIAFMEDLIAHQDEEIKVRFLGDEYNTDIVMTDSMKDALVTFYQLYVKAGGTLFEDMGIVTETIMEVE